MTVSLLPNGKQQFIDIDGNPLVNGRVYFYVPNTTNPKTTWQDAAETILNTNPVVLDSRGQATIWGDGSYRQVLKDAEDNTIWDKDVTSYPDVPTQSVFATSLSITVTGNGSSPSTGVCGDRVCPFAGTITDWYLQADQSGSIVVNVWKKAFATDSPPTVANKITASAPPTLSSQQQIKSTALTGWTTSVSAGDAFRFNIDSITTITQFTLTLFITRTVTLS
jgi:hypothetical protein